jgi:hypothetical protein
MRRCETQTLRGRDPEPIAFPIEVVAELLVASPGELRRLAGALRRQAHRLVWRKRTAQRNSVISRALRLCERAIGPPYEGRERSTNGAWVLYALVDGKRIPVATVRPPKLMRFEDFTAAMVVHVHAVEHLDLALLEARFGACDANRKQGPT